MKLRIGAIAGAALLGSLALPALSGQAVAAPGDLYVNKNNAACTDTGSGTERAPYCSIQAAADLVLPGQTVHVARGQYPAGLKLTRSGTAEAPITFLGGADAPGDVNNEAAINASGATVPAITVSGARHVSLNGFTVLGGDKPAVLVQNSSAVSLMRGLIGGGRGPAVQVTGESSGVTVGRYRFLNNGTSVQVDPGVRGTVVTTNYFHNDDTVVAATDAPGTVVVANTVRSECHPGIVLAGASTGSTVENNAVETGKLDDSNHGGACADGSAATGITVAEAATAGTLVDYNVVSPLSGGAAYSWAGHAYAGQAQFAATGQGAHDLVADPMVPTDGRRPVGPTVDSADEKAPGMLPVDLSGYGAVDDPLVANSGTGAGYRDRGATEYREFGSLYTPLAPRRVLDTRSGLGTTAAGPVRTDGYVHLKLPAELKGAKAVTMNVTVTAPTSAGYLTVYPDGVGGTTGISNLNWTAGTTIANLVTVPVTDDTVWFHVGGQPGTVQIVADLQGSYGQQGNAFTPTGPARVLDTREGNGAALRQGQTLDLPLAGLRGIPADATAVTLNMTVTQPTDRGYLTVYPAGTERPTASNLNWVPGQTIANLVTVPVKDGKVTLFAGGGQGEVHVVADVAGYYSPGSYGTFRSVTPYRLLDTRQDGTAEPVRKAAKVPARGTLDLAIGGKPELGDPSSRNGVAVLNVTVTNTSTPGFLTAYPYGTERPLASNLNWTAGQTIPNQVVVPVKNGKISLYNGSTGSTDLVVDVLGYQTW
ncbi:hypothetical protein CFP65_6680 [Kitasatospora sp. MMS16-BH015]|uniref:right-handed parallel beta-helix repeat-containing protein n=1 Tax=Kitasatospora sp. MMS16-BH015 TaxID=2018025 RepID=UPI000CA21883|nr:right-handed parallel beta-helix repeat-containing protein [Kitasatospora sp. MMS16-BH015]AUG81325.1 hypothetical protein CFP65_6680 [Kitasatospora sp. MMS16-BH015]